MLYTNYVDPYIGDDIELDFDDDVDFNVEDYGNLDVEDDVD
jgi:hypothetical protein